MKTIQDLMLDVFHVCQPGDPLEQAQTCLSLSGREELPVVDREGRIIGALAQRDLDEASGHLKETGGETCVADLMRDAAVIHVYEDEAEAFRLMRRSKASGLFAVDQFNRLQGRISFVSLARRVISLRQRFRNIRGPELSVC
jgi:predicted transcriptional regulator